MGNNRNQRNQVLAARVETTVGSPAAIADGAEAFEPLDPRTIAQPGAATPPLPAATNPAPAAPSSASNPLDGTRTVMVEVPTLRGGAGYVTRSLGRRPLSPAQAQTLRDVVDALVADRAALESGRAVAEPDDAVAWILERIAGVGRAPTLS